MTVGILASVVGAVGIGVGVGVESLPVMMAAKPSPAGAVAAIYVVSYLAFGLPIVIAGELKASLGMVATVLWYSALAIL